MIESLKEDLVRLLLDGIKYDRLGETGSTLGTQFQSDAVIKGVINSFVSVEEYKKKGNLEVAIVAYNAGELVHVLQLSLSLTFLQLYEEIFEKAFLQATGEYYKEEAQKLLQEDSISLYMERVIQRIESENVRSRKFLYPSSYQKVLIVHAKNNLFIARDAEITKSSPV